MPPSSPAPAADPELWSQLGLWGSSVMSGAKPFVKWVGGKRNLLNVIHPLIPDAPKRYVEPFIGGGAVFLSTQHRPAVISDVNPRLIATYRAVRDDVDTLIGMLAEHEQVTAQQEHYYASRDRFNDPACTGTELAALFIYLNKAGFNGLYRESSTGRFNASWGKYDTPSVLDEPNLRACAKSLQNTDILCGSWSHIAPLPGDFWYLDPPYHDTFTKYAAGDFSEAAQTALAARCRELDSLGAKFMLSNSDTDLIRTLYAGFTHKVVRAARRVSNRGDQRGDVDELLIHN